MFRRRRRRSSFTRGAPPQARFIVLGVGAAVLVGLFIFFLHQADVLAPAPSELTIALPDTFKE